MANKGGQYLPFFSPLAMIPPTIAGYGGVKSCREEWSSAICPWANCYRARQAEEEEQGTLRDSPSGTAATNPAEFDLQPKARRI